MQARPAQQPAERKNLRREVAELPADSTENERCKCAARARLLVHAALQVLRRDALGRDDVHLEDLYTESGHTLQGSFTAVLKPIFASK